MSAAEQVAEGCAELGSGAGSVLDEAEVTTWVCVSDAWPMAELVSGHGGGGRRGGVGDEAAGCETESDVLESTGRWEICCGSGVAAVC